MSETQNMISVSTKKRRSQAPETLYPRDVIVFAASFVRSLNVRRVLITSTYRPGDEEHQLMARHRLSEHNRLLCSSQPGTSGRTWFTRRALLARHDMTTPGGILSYMACDLSDFILLCQAKLKINLMFLKRSKVKAIVGLQLGLCISMNLPVEVRQK